MASNSTNKRRRTAADTLHISDLPVGFIADVSAYLPKPSRAILAVAFTSSSLLQNNDLMHRLSPISTAIISAQQWDMLDFEDINKELANKLTDDDIYAILKSINAHDVLKKLKLCGCINITGIGLNPLQGSVVLEQIDLSLVRKYEEPRIKSIPKISHETVMPILDSIVSENGCSLKHIVFPHIWRVGERRESVESFQRRYNAMFRMKSNSCSHCNANMRDHEYWMSGNVHCNVCYDCLKPFCEECVDELGLENGILTYCHYCEKDFCQDCVPRVQCAERYCHEKICSGCAETCHVCEERKCANCLFYCENCKRYHCAGCSSYYGSCEGIGCIKAHCGECYDGKECDVKPCEECDTFYCSGCRVEKVKKDGMASCRSCAADITPLVVADEMNKLRKENEELRAKAARDAEEKEAAEAKLERIALLTRV